MLETGAQDKTTKRISGRWFEIFSSSDLIYFRATASVSKPGLNVPWMSYYTSGNSSERDKSSTMMKLLLEATFVRASLSERVQCFLISVNIYDAFACYLWYRERNQSKSLQNISHNHDRCNTWLHHEIGIFFRKVTKHLILCYDRDEKKKTIIIYLDLKSRQLAVYVFDSFFLKPIFIFKRYRLIFHRNQSRILATPRENSWAVLHRVLV